jgi:hypothetical protein
MKEAYASLQAQCNFGGPHPPQFVTARSTRWCPSVRAGFPTWQWGPSDSWDFVPAAELVADSGNETRREGPCMQGFRRLRG